MTILRDVLETVKHVAVLVDQVDRGVKLIDRMTDRLNEHDRRLVRLETIVDRCCEGKTALIIKE